MNSELGTSCKLAPAGEIVQYPATHYRLRNNGNDTFHGFPIDETAEPIRTGNTNLNTNSH